MQPSKRLLSLDVFRGITIAGMILVNNPGSWSTVYAPLLHAEWHGATPTDWIFPFFLFIVGVAIPLALGKRQEQGVGFPALVRKIGSRSVIIFGLGLFLAAFPNFGFRPGYAAWLPLHYTLLAVLMVSVFLREALNQKHIQREALRKILGYLALFSAGGMVVLGLFAYDLSSLRIPGVLQRIAVVYFACSLLYLFTDWRAQAWTAVGLLLSYWVLMTLVPVPGGGAPNLEPGSNLAAWVDSVVLEGHMWSQTRTWDPEGLLSTLPAIATGIIGMLCGIWIRARVEKPYQMLTGLFGAGTVLLALSLVWDVAFPLNKSLWTSSFVLYTGGIALLFLALVYWLVDVLGYKGWIGPFRIYGVNPLFAYVLSGILAKLAYTIRWEGADGTVHTFGGMVYSHLFASWLGPYNASLGYALLNVLVCYAAVWVLYRWRIYIKV